jgi:hypothetical protein
MRPPLRLTTDQEETMSRTRSRNSPPAVIALAAAGAALALVGAALAQGVQPPAVQAGPGAGPHTFQGGTGGVTPGTLQPGAAAGALNAYGKPGAAGIIAPDFLRAAPPASPHKVLGAEPPPSPGGGTGATTLPVGPRGAAYLKSPKKEDPKGPNPCATGQQAC